MKHDETSQWALSPHSAFSNLPSAFRAKAV